MFPFGQYVSGKAVNIGHGIMISKPLSREGSYKIGEMIQRQGGDINVLDNPPACPRACYSQMSDENIFHNYKKRLV